MTVFPAGLFTTGIVLTGIQRFLLMLPLCLSIAIVYKTTRCETVGDVPLSSVALCATIVIGMVGVGVGLWLFFLWRL